ncbi:MAG: KamA family radical SAM protein [Deltaproteobacteria bacterium]|nr:KamA family radical SAM protein [Deltaproteobacteria bacterium]
MPLFQYSGNSSVSKEVPQDTEDEPPSNCTPLKKDFSKTQTFYTRYHKPVIIFPFSGKRAPRTSVKTKIFRRRYFPLISDKQWNDWHWQINNRIRSISQLEQFVVLSHEERTAMSDPTAKLPVGITPYFLSLLSPNDPMSPLRRTVIPTLNELFSTPEEADDPLGEEHQSPVPGLVHRYPDRVLLLALDFCSTYCRYCTRSRLVGHGTLYPTRSRLERAFDYIEANPRIRDVLISGGDPLTLSDDRLAWILASLRRIPHVEIIRIGTKIPAVLPQRVTPQLIRMLRRYHPVWMSLHFTHPEECTPEAYKACAMLADAGIPLGSQTVLLSGINDNVDTMRNLVHHLLKMRVRPYYLYQCDPISGSSHFRTSVDKGLEIIRGLRGFTSGYAVPTYVIDAPGGGGKIPVMPDYVTGRDGQDWTLQNYEGNEFHYPLKVGTGVSPHVADPSVYGDV